MPTRIPFSFSFYLLAYSNYLFKKNEIIKNPHTHKFIVVSNSFVSFELRDIINYNYQ